MTEPKVTKHDKVFKKAMENPMVAKEFFGSHLPPHIKSIVDTSSLKMEKESFVEQSLKSSVSDILFSVKFNSSPGYLYLLAEHQSTSDHLMAFRLFRYMTNIIQRHMEKNPKEKHLPLVYPLVFYNGKQKYTAPLNIWELFGNSALAKEIWTSNYNLVNLQEIPDEEFKKRSWCGIMEFFMKNIHNRNLIEKMDSIAELFPEIAKLTVGLDYLELMLTYSLTAIDKNDRIRLEKVLKDHLNIESGDKLMTSLAEHFTQEGIEKGILQGMEIGEAKGIERGIEKGREEGIERGREEGIEINKVATARNLLRLKLPLEVISESTGLSKEKLQALIQN